MLTFAQSAGPHLIQRCRAQTEVNHVTVKAIIEVGHAMNLKVIAEFVEDVSSIVRVRDLGVDFAQGCGVARPTPLTLSAAVA